MTAVRHTTEPAGKGFYVRDHLAPLTGISAASIAMLKGVGVRFVATSFRNRLTAARLEAAGVYVWTFGSLNDWDPAHWRETLRLSMLASRASGSNRIWADCEVGWKDVDPAGWKALGDALVLASEYGYQIAFTTHDGLRKRTAARIGDQLARIRAVVSPQVMDHQAGAPLDYAEREVEKWTRSFPGCVIVPTVGSFNEDGSETDGRYADVFRAYPASWHAAIVWPEHKPNARELAALRAWKVGRGIEL